MYKKHPDLAEPDDSQTIWHYFSLAKFLGLIDKSALYLSRHDKFDDGFEGALSEKDIQYFDSTKPGMAEYMKGDNVGCYYSNSWTKSDVDEYVLWSSYASLSDGVAVQSTVARLLKSLDAETEKDVYVSDVLYIDYSKDFTFKKTGGIVNTLGPHFTKRDFFQSEKELRIMYVDPTGHFKTSPAGVEIKVDLATLIENAYVAPFSFPWLADTVNNILMKYNLTNLVVKKSNI